MKSSRFALAFFLLATSILSTSVAAAPTVISLVNSFPAADSRTEGELAAKLLAEGQAGLGELFAMIIPLGTGDDTKARFAVAALARHASRAGGEADRALFNTAAATALGASRDPEVSSFLIQHLQLAPSAESVPALAKLLDDPKLCDPAANGLAAINAPAAFAALSKGYAGSKGACRIALTRALGALRSGTNLQDMLKDAESADSSLRLIALWAVANIGAGDPTQTVLAKAANAAKPYDRAKATSYLLLYARRRGEAGATQQAEQICRQLIQSRNAPPDVNIRCEALSSLVSILKDQALDDLLAAADSNDPEYRAAAIGYAQQIQGAEATAKWVAKSHSASPQSRAQIAAMLGRRGDKSAAAAVAAMLMDEDEAVRAAAISALPKLAGENAAAGLIKVVQGGNAADSKLAVAEMSRMSGQSALAAAAAALPGSTAKAKVALLELLAGRAAREQIQAVYTEAAGSDESVRAAALRSLEKMAGEEDIPKLQQLAANAANAGEELALLKAIVAATSTMKPQDRAGPLLAMLETAAPAKKAAILRQLPRVPGERALAALGTYTTAEDAGQRDAAIRALAEWPDVSAVGALIKASTASKELTHQVLAIRAAIQLTKGSKQPSADKLKVYRQLLVVSPRVEEKRLVLAAIPAERNSAALAMLVEFLEDASLNEEAANDILRLILPAKPNQQPLAGDNVAAALQKAIPLSKDANLKKQGELLLAKLKPAQ